MITLGVVIRHHLGLNNTNVFYCIIIKIIYSNLICFLLLVACNRGLGQPGYVGIGPNAAAIL